MNVMLIHNIYIHVFLQLILYLTSIYTGIKLSKSKNNKTCFWLMVIVFTLIEGLRFGRGIDYNIYVEVYNYIVNYNIFVSPESFIFNGICLFLGYLNLPYQSLILVCSFILIYNGLKLLLRWNDKLMYILPLFIYLCYSAQNLMKWYTGFAFILVAINAILDNKKRKAILFSIIAIGVHPMLITVLPLFYIAFLYKKPILSPWATICIFLIMSFVWSRDFMLGLTNLVELVLGASEHYSMYSQNAEMWLTGSNRDDSNLSFISLIKIGVYFSFYIFVGKRFLKTTPTLLYPYNLLLLGIITYPAMHNIELFDRMNQLLIFFQCIIGGYCFYYSFHNRKIWLIGFLLFFWQIKMIVSNVVIPDNKWYTLYIWDSKGKDSIDKEYLLN